MRTLKFRIWDGKKMTYPQTVEIGINGVNGLTSGSYQLDDGGYCTSAYVMQFTGLLDKQGKEIYEGDIVKQMDIDWDKTSSDTEPVNYVMKETMRDVVTMDRFPCYWLKNEHFGYEGEDLIANEDCEIIGNIYENPELLKGERK